MLKGQVFKEQIFENQIFAVFINTFLAGKNGIINGYKNSMQVTAGTNTVTIQSGVICIQGRFLEEDTEYTLATGTDTAFCKLVIEIDLNKVNTETDFTQGCYKIIKGATDYPDLTQDDIANINYGVYQYELARFKTSLNGISEFSDRREYIDYDSLYKLIEQKLNEVEDGSIYVLQSQFKEFEKKIKNLYPIGAIYLSMTSTNPSEYFGGTWAQIAKGRTLFGVDSSQEDYSEPNKNGGISKYKLSQSQLPNYALPVIDPGHDHDIPGSDWGSGTSNSKASTEFSTSEGPTATTKTEKTGILVRSGGGGEEIDNRPAFLTCYIWQRTA